MPDRKCPCGSGKKISICCGEKDKIVDLNKYRWWRTGQHLRKKLAEFADNEMFMEEAEIARESYYGVMDPKFADEEDDFLLERFFEWFIFDFDIRGKTLLEFFKLNENLSSQEKELLHKWQNAKNSIYQVMEIKENNIALQDLLRGGTVEVKDGNVAEELYLGNILLMRILPVGDYYEFSTGGLVLPAHSKEYLMSRMKFDTDLYWRKKGKAENWGTYLQERAHIVNALVMEIGTIVWDMPEFSNGLHQLQINPQGLSSKLTQRVSDMFLDYFYEHWVNEPLDILQGKTPLEASLIKSGRKKLQVVLSELGRIENARAQKGEPFYDLSKLVDKLRIPIESEALSKLKKVNEPSRTDVNYTEVSDMIRDGLDEMGYREQQVKGAVALWQKYSQVARPACKKPGAWAAAVIYAVVRILGDKSVNQNDLAEMYSVSVSTISSNYRNILSTLKINDNINFDGLKEQQMFLDQLFTD